MVPDDRAMHVVQLKNVSTSRKIREGDVPASLVAGSPTTKFTLMNSRPLEQSATDKNETLLDQ